MSQSRRWGDDFFLIPPRGFRSSKALAFAMQSQMHSSGARNLDRGFSVTIVISQCDVEGQVHERDGWHRRETSALNRAPASA